MCFFYTSKPLQALYIRTRDRTIGAQRTRWKPSDQTDHIFDEVTRQLFEYRLLEPRTASSLLSYLKMEPIQFRNPQPRELLMHTEDVALAYNLSEDKAKVYDILEKYKLVPVDCREFGLKPL